MNNNSNMILLLISIIIIILSGVSYLEFKKIKIELDKHKEILSMYKDKIELLLDLNKKLTQERNNYNVPENTYNESYINTNVKQNNEYIPDVVAKVEVDVIDVAKVEVGVVEEVDVIEVEVDVIEIEVGVIEEVEVGVIEEEVEVDVEEVDVDIIEEVDVIDNGSIDTEADNGSIDISNIDSDIDNMLNDISINKSEEYEVLNNKKKELFDIYIEKSVKELREILMEKNLPLSGNKTKQVHRILDNL